MAAMVTISSTAEAGTTGSPAGRVETARVDNGSDTITDFNSTEDTILLDRFSPAEIEVRREGDTTIISLAGRGQIMLLGVTQLDDDDLAFR